MSTKTMLKRIALVAAAALGAGGLSVIAVPTANAATFTNISIGTIPGARVGGTIVVPITINHTAHAASETITVAVKAVSAPSSGGSSNAPSVFHTTTSTTNADGTEVLYFSDAGGTVLDTADYDGQAKGTAHTTGAAVNGMFKAGTTTAGNIDAAAAGGVPATALTVATSSTANSASTTVRVAVKPDVAGTYSFIVSVVGLDPVTANTAHHSYVAGDLSTTFSFTTVNAPTTATLTAVGGSSSTNAAGTYGALYKLTLTDSAGNPSTLIGDEAFKITPSAGTISKATVSTAGVFASVAPASTSVTFVGTDMVNGVGYFNAKASTASATVTLTGSNAGSLATSISAAATYTTAASATSTAATNTFKKAAGTAVTSGWAASGVKIPTTSTSDTIELAYTGATTAKYGYLTIVDNSGKISGAPSTSTLTYDRAYTQAAMTTAGADYVTVSVPHAACAAGTCYTVTDSGSASIGAVTAEASAMTDGAVSISSPATSFRMATGGSATFTIAVEDQFANAKSNVGVAVSFSGRNGAKAGATVVTDSDGLATYVFTDTGTTGATDTITFTATVSDSATITYGDVAAGSVLVTTPNTTSTGVDEYPLDPEDISAADGAEAGIKTVTATVKDAAAVVMSGVLVTWTVTGDGCALLSTTVSGYTGAAGTDTASVYAWKAGTCTVTATAGGKSDSAPAIFAQETPTEARTIAATVSGNQITATVTDRFGNTIEGVPVKVTRTAGTGYFGSASTATANTDAAGTVTFIVTGGSATVTVGFETSTYGQSDALKGLKDGTTATNTFTAYTAGTALVAEEGVGASFDAAGVNSVSVSVTASDSATTAGNAATAAAEAATDAAAEAIDAANAATDAANLAAEAADAATVAAEEARDAADAATAAVEELATQVATLMAALKAQITTLANTVAKIAKKVKA